MSDYCRQCSIKLFGKDFEDMKGITTEDEYKKGLAAIEICEGCGTIFVDPEGNCISEDCLRNGHK